MKSLSSFASFALPAAPALAYLYQELHGIEFIKLLILKKRIKGTKSFKYYLKYRNDSKFRNYSRTTLMYTVVSSDRSY